MNNSVCIYCGSNEGVNPLFKQQSIELSKLLSKHGFNLVYGGGKTGLMGVVADEFLKNNRNVVGVRPLSLIATEEKHEGIQKLIEVDTMYQRKAKMIELANNFLILPGGIGTLDELADLFCHLKLEYKKAKCVILNVDGCYDSLNSLFVQMVQNGFLQEEDLKHVAFFDNTTDAFNYFVK